MLRALFLAGLLSHAMPALAQQRPEIVYRRVFVPEESVQRQVRGLLPMRREEFERRLAQATTAGDPLAGQAVMRIEAATYRARLEGDELRGGTAELQIASRVDGPALAPLAPLTPVLESAQWLLPSRPAVLGVDPGGTLQCLVESAGTLQLAWSLRGETAIAGVLSFDVRLPPAPRTQLVVETPADVQIAVDRGIATVADSEQPQRRVWTIDLGGSARTRLEVRRTSLREPDRPLLVARTTSNYTVFRSAVDLEASIALDVLRQPLRELRVIADKPLEITSVRMGPTPLAWSPIAADSESESAVRVELPADPADATRSIQVTATAAWPGDQPWTLPRLRLPDAVFQEGEATIAASRWLRLATRPVSGCFQSGVAAGGAATAVDQFRYHLYADDARIEVVTDPQWAVLHEESGTHIQIDSSQVSGVMIAEIASRGGEVFSLEASVPRHWIVDAVETQPADMLADRSITSRSSGPQRLRISMRRPIMEGRPLRLIVRGHFRRPADDQSLPGGFFELASFPAIRQGRRLIAVRLADPGVQLELGSSQEVRQVDPQALSTADLRLFETPPGPIVFESPRSGELPAVALVPTAARYRGEVLMQALVERSRVQQQATIVCRPESSSVQSLLVQVTPAPAGAVAWRLVGEDDHELTATLVPAAERPEGTEGSLYRLALQRPRSTAFQVQGEWQAPRSGGDSIGLAWLPEAAAQQATVEVHSVDGMPLLVQPSEMSPLPAMAQADDRLTTLRARYRYEAGRRASLRIAAQSAGSLPAAWIESLTVASRFAASGHGDHEATLVVHNTGLDRFALRLAADADDVRLVTVGDDQETALSQGNEGELTVPLPPEERRSIVRLHYQSRGRPMGVRPLAHLTAPIPQADLPVLARSWSVSLSPRLASVAGNQAAMRYDAAFAGWTTRALELPPGDKAVVHVYRPAVMRTWAICLALIAGAAALRTPPRWSVPLAGLLAAGAVLTPAPLAWLLGGASLGAAVGLVAALAQPRRQEPREAPAAFEPALSTTVAAARGAPAVFLVWSALATALGAAPGDEAAASRPRVVIPVDDEQQPTGDYVFLAPELYEALHRLAERGPTALPEWLIESARYELPAAPTGDAATPTVGEVRGIFELHTFQPAAVVRLPLKRSQILLLEGQAKLDGQPITPVWLADGSALAVSIDMPGRHRLELAFGAPATREDELARLTLDIPPAARTTAVLPADASGVRVRSFEGAVQGEQSGAAATFRLGGSRRLEVRWPLPGGEASRAPMVEGEQLLWWRIRPGSVVLDGLFRLRPVGGVVRGATFSVDPRLRLAPGVATPPIDRVTTDPLSPHQVRIELIEPAATEVELRLSWLWPTASGLGTLVLPQVEMQTDRLVRRWTAVSVDPSFELHVADGASAAPTEALEFVQAWGASAAPPTVVIGEESGRRGVSIAVHPAEATPRARQNAEWSLSSLAAVVEYTAQLSGISPRRLEHRVAMPPQARITSVVLQQEDRPAAIRWSQQAGELIVTLLEGTAAEQTLHVRAEIPLARQRPRYTLPAIQLEDALASETRIKIYRQADVLVELQRAAGWTRQDDPELGSYRDGRGRLVATLVQDATVETTQPVISRQPNEAQAAGSLLIQASENDGAWDVQLDLGLDIRHGALDEVRLALPGDWNPSLTIEPPAQQHWLDVAGQLRQLVVRPQLAATERLELSLHGSLSSTGGIRVPDVSVQGDAAVERFVLLDTRAGSERISWETTGLQPVDAGAANVPPAGLAADGELFRAVGPRFEAVARIQQTARPSPRIHLADIHIQMRPANRIVGQAEYIVQPAGARQLELAMPGGHRLVQVQIDGVPAQIVRSGLRQWAVAAPSEHVPFRITVYYDAALAAEPGRPLRLAAPQWQQLDVPQACWTIEDASGKAWQAAPATRAAASEELELFRVEAAAKALEELAGVAAGTLPSELTAASYRQWRVALNEAIERLHRGAPREGLSREVEQRIEAAEERAKTVQRRLAQARGGPLGDQGRASPGPSGAEADEGKAHALYLVTSQPAASVILVRGGLAADRLDLSALAALLVGGLSLAAWPLVQRRWLRQWLVAHAHFVLALVGIAWWLFAPANPPVGWLGWLLIVAAGWLALRWPWRTSGQEAGSTIRRLPLR